MTVTTLNKPTTSLARPVLAAVFLITAGSCGSKGKMAKIDSGITQPPLADAQVEPPWEAIACTGSEVLCVDSAGEGQEIGTAEAPFHSIGAAIAAAPDGGIIQVAAATYQESLVIRDTRIKLYGGFPGSGNFSDRSPAGNETIVDAGGTGPAVAIITAEGTRVDGFHLTNGIGFCDSDTCHGGGVYIDQGVSGEDAVPVEIAYCEIYDNNVRKDGHNTARGGGLYVQGAALITRNHVHDNTAERGAAMASESTVHIIENRFVDNSAYGDHGGGLHLSGKDIKLIANYIAGNEQGKELGYGWGGGVLFASVGTSFVSRENTITDNKAASGGSGFFVDDGAVGEMHNDLIVSNHCGEQGAGGLVVDALDNSGNNGSVVHAYNLTIANNGCTGVENAAGSAIWVEGKGSEVHLYNSILWNNAPALSNVDGLATMTAVYTLSQDPIPGDGNLSENPLFVDASGGNFHLQSAGGSYKSGSFMADQASSPAIDTGNPNLGFSRETSPNGGRLNLGAYGNTNQASRSP